MADQVERVILEAEDQVSQQVGAANASLDKFEKRAESSHQKVIRITDQTRSSVQRLITSLEKQAETYGKSGVDKLISQRDQLLQRYAKEPAAVDAITKSYERMIQVQKELNSVSAASGGEGGSGFNARYAFFGVKDLMEGRTKFALAEAANELMRLRGGALLLGGVAAGVLGIGFAAYEVKQRLEELADMPEKLRVQFGRLNDVTRAANDEMRVANDRLENSIAKLEHKPENNLKLAIDEAAVAAEHLAEKMDRSLHSFLALVKESSAGVLDRMFFHQTNDKDIEQFIGGKSGLGGMIGEVYKITNAGGDPSSVLGGYRSQAQHMLDMAQYSLAVRSGKRAYDPKMGPWDATSDLAPRIEKLEALIAQIGLLSDSYGLEKKNVSLTSREQVLRSQAAGDRAGESAVKTWQRQAAEFEKKGDEAELDAISKIYYARDALLAQGEKLKRSEQELAAVRKAADEQADVIYKKAKNEFDISDAGRRAGYGRSAIAMMAPSAAQMKDWESGFSAQSRIEDIGVQAQKAELQRRAARAGRMAQLNGGSDEEIAQSTYQTRVNLALQLAAIEQARIDKEEDANKKSVMAAQMQKDLFAQLSEAQDQFDEKKLQMQQKREQEIQSQIDGIQKQASSLIDTLLTHPRNFGRQLAGTVRSAVLHPVVESLSSGVANFLQPLIYGSGGGDPVRVSTDQNTAATIQNSMAMAALTAVLSAGMGISAPSMAGGTIGGLPGISVPSISAPVAAAQSFFSSGTIPGMILPDGGLAGVAGASGGGGSMRISGGGGGRGGGFNLGGMFGGFKGLMSKDSWWNNDIYTSAGNATTAAGIGGIGGTLAAALTSKGAGQLELAAGMPLALAGLTGGRMGSWGGIAESTGGGALVGAGIGTMIMPGIGTAIGAGIGAGAGFLAGGLEKLLGIESPAVKAHNDIKSIYGVDIPTNSGTIKQIVSLAQSQYGGNIAVAVRSPSVRQLVMLYSEATGQKTPLSASTPYGGSLVEQGGSLYQQASYMDGQAHVYASNIPTLGGIAASNYPTQAGPAASGGGVNLSLAINGTQISPQFVADQSMAAQGASYGRTQQAANLQVPGLMVA